LNNKIEVAQEEIKPLQQRSQLPAELLETGNRSLALPAHGRIVAENRLERVSHV